MADFAAMFNSLPPDKQEELLNGPASPPPHGVVSNFDNPPNQNHLSLGVTNTGLVISSLFVILWIFSKAFCLRKIHVEDGFIFAGYGIFVGYTYCLYYWINLTGMYVHTWDVRLRTTLDFSYIVYVGQNLYGASVGTLKVGVLLQWARIFVPRNFRDPFWWAYNTTLVLNVLFYGSAKFVDNFACSPHEKIWDPTVEGHCINMRAETLVSAIVNLVSDLVILALPQMVIWKLNMSRAKRLGISCVFAVGILYGKVLSISNLIT
ncbi:hypothetical protein F4861DRAFT_285973 [Xylaria intraflava]|nr:hypothetical protein F4861DRAFT_285973 [Xylaria intraflava]